MNFFLPKRYSDIVAEKGGTSYLKALIDADQSPVVTNLPVVTNCPHCGIRTKRNGLPCWHCGQPTA